MPRILSVNLGTATASEHSDVGVTGIDKRPASGPVQVHAPGPKGVAGSGVAGDTVCDLRHHGGDDQAVYAYSREDLDGWANELGRVLPNGCFGENLTTEGLDITAALIGERWAIGRDLVLEVSVPRLPCRTFAGWLAEQRWVKRYTARGLPGTYLRVINPGTVAAGDALVVAERPQHDVTVGLAFRALTTQRTLLPRLLAAQALPTQARRAAQDGQLMHLDQ